MNNNSKFLILIILCCSFYNAKCQGSVFCVFVEKVDTTYLNVDYLLVHGKSNGKKLKILINLYNSNIDVFENQKYVMVLDDLFDLYDLNFKGDTIRYWHGDPPKWFAYTRVSKGEDVITMEFRREKNFYQCLAILFENHSVLDKLPCSEISKN